MKKPANSLNALMTRFVVQRQMPSNMFKTKLRLNLYFLTAVEHLNRSPYRLGKM